MTSLSDARPDRKTDARRRTLMQADARMAKAKARFSLAALACMRGALDAEALVQAALFEIEAARATLRALADG